MNDDSYVSLRAVIGLLLAAVAFVSGWDAAALFVRPETFEASAAYASVFSRADPFNIATFFAVMSGLIATCSAMTLAGRDMPRWLVPVLLALYAMVVAAFADSIFDLGWTAGTGALKWAGWAASCCALAAFDLYRTSDRAGRMLDNADELGYEFVRKDRERGGVQFGAIAPVAVIAGTVVLAISDTVLLALIGLPGSLITAYGAFFASRRTSRLEKREESAKLEARLMEREKVNDERAENARRRWMELEHKYDDLTEKYGDMRAICRALLAALVEVAPDHPTVEVADKALSAEP